MLCLLGVSGLFALVAVFRPVSWMVATHRWLGLGEMPVAPVVKYLARSLSAIYVPLSALRLVVASDLERYRPLVCFLAVAVVLMSVVFNGVDLAAGMPWWWSERPSPDWEAARSSGPRFAPRQGVIPSQWWASTYRERCRAL